MANTKEAPSQELGEYGAAGALGTLDVKEGLSSGAGREGERAEQKAPQKVAHGVGREQV